MKKVLFVCTGNTCRSPMAQYIYNALAKEKALPLVSESCGLAAFSGDTPSDGAVCAMEEIGIDITSHRARKLTSFLIDESDYIALMSEKQKQLLMNFCDEKKLIIPKREISDPFGGDIIAYRRCRDELTEYVKKVFDYIYDLTIEAMNEKTVLDVAEIEKKCFSVPWSENSLRQELLNEGSFFYTASFCGEIVGYIGMQIVLDEAYVTNVAVKENFRRRGIAERLLLKCVSVCKERSCAFLSLEVRKSNSGAIALYEKNGFSVCGERKNFYSLPTENALIMTVFLTKDDIN